MNDDATDEGPEAAQELGGEVVLEGAHEDMTWQVRVDGDDDELFSMLYLYRGEKMLDGGGMGGPPLQRGSLIEESRGYSDEAPWQILVRADPNVTSVVATTERGVRLPVPLSPVVQPYGLRFGVATPGKGDAPGGLTVETAGGVGTDHAAAVPPTSPPGTSSGWAPL